MKWMLGCNEMWWNEIVINENGEEIRLFEIRKPCDVVDDAVEWNEIRCEKRWCGELGWKKEKERIKWKCDEMWFFEIRKPHNAISGMKMWNQEV